MHERRLRTEGLTWEAIDGEVVALDLVSSEYFGLNGSAAVLWGQLAGGSDRSDLVAHLVAAFGVPEAQAAQDVDDFLAELDRLGLLEPEP